VQNAAQVKVMQSGEELHKPRHALALRVKGIRLVLAADPAGSAARRARAGRGRLESVLEGPAPAELLHQHNAVLGVSKPSVKAHDVAMRARLEQERDLGEWVGRCGVAGVVGAAANDLRHNLAACWHVRCLEDAGEGALADQTIGHLHVVPVKLAQGGDFRGAKAPPAAMRRGGGGRRPA